MASALGVEIAQGSGADLESALETSLNRGPLLLLVDNCEHLLEGIAPLLGKLLRHCPQLTILATSREWLRVTGEVTYPVPTFDISRGGLGDLEQLGELIKQDIASIPGIGKVETFLVYSEVMPDKGWPIEAEGLIEHPTDQTSE